MLRISNISNQSTTFVKKGKPNMHDDIIKWKHFMRYWSFVRGIHRSPVNSSHKGQWRGALMFSLICAWINSWVKNREAGDLRRHRAHYDVTEWILIIMMWDLCIPISNESLSKMAFMNPYIRVSYLTYITYFANIGLRFNTLWKKSD